MNTQTQEIAPQDKALVDTMAQVWDNIEALCSGLSEADWKKPSDLPGWTVKDIVSHIVDLEQILDGQPRPDHTAPDVEWVKNDLGKFMEIGVDFRRGRTGSEVFDEYKQIVSRRLNQLRSVKSDGFDKTVPGVVGPAKLRDLLSIRMFDLWIHEQDLRRALDKPGGTDTPAALHCLNQLISQMGYVVAKKAGAADGIYRFEIDGYKTFDVVVEARRGRTDEAPSGSKPDLELRMDANNFVKALSGRTEPAVYEVVGDEALGAKIVENMNVMP